MLKEELKALHGKSRKFLILRIAGVDKNLALNLCSAKESSYNHWTIQDEFKKVYQRLDELHTEYRDEAVAILRNDNLLALVSLESEMLAQVRQEIKDGEPVFARTHLAREIYSKLAAEIGTAQVTGNTWEAKVLQINMNNPPQPALTLNSGEVIDAKSETDSSEEEEHKGG